MAAYSTALTASENLAIEVIAARFRLGEKGWNFDSRHMATLRGLEAKGLIILTPTSDDKAISAYLTQVGRDAYITDDYIPPIVKEFHERIAGLQSGSADPRL